MQRWLTGLVMVALMMLPAAAAADGRLDIASWLKTPNVKLLAVDFYADWCEPCKAAIPHWERLLKKYRNNGLRVVIVTVQSEGKCLSLNWTPDDTVCDYDGTLAEAWRATSLPQGFLWNWRGDMLVGHGEVGPIEKAIEEYFAREPRVIVSEPTGRGGVALQDGGLLKRIVQSKLKDNSKFEVVAGADEMKRMLQVMKQAEQSAAYAEGGRCEVGQALPPNSKLDIVVAEQRGAKRLGLELYDLQKGCLVASEFVSVSGSDEQAAAEGVARLVFKVAGEVRLPGSPSVPGRRQERKVAEGRIGQQAEAWNPEAGVEHIITFESDPPGAVVMDGADLLCSATPCSKLLAAGQHRIAMQKEEYDKRSEGISVSRKDTVNWKLTPNFGWISVASEPAGLDVQVDGKKAGTTPLSRFQASPGGHEVLVVSSCHYEAGERVNVEKGVERKVSVALSPKEGAVKVTAEDEAGNAVEADVTIDGVKVGSAPGTYKVSVCAREVVVVGPHGRTVKQAVQVREREVVTVRAVLKSGGVAGAAGIEWVSSRPARLRFAKSETTVAQYAACVQAGTCRKENYSTKTDHQSCNWGYSERASHPMNCVSWHGADEFCRWAGGRLPTEEEWYAEASNGESRQYPWGNQQVTCDYAVWGDGSNTDGCGKNSTWPVCSKQKGNSISGLCDMSGNVWEWTSSSEGSARVLRGGSWLNDNPDALRASYRNWIDPSDRDYSHFGFRCVVPPE